MRVSGCRGGRHACAAGSRWCRHHQPQRQTRGGLFRIARSVRETGGMPSPCGYPIRSSGLAVNSGETLRWPSILARPSPTRLSPMNPTHRTVRRSLPWLLAALSMIGPFSIDAVFPSFPLIGAHFKVDDAALQQLISVYLVMYAYMSLFHGAISDAIGRKPVIATGMLVYAFASA